MKLFQMSCSHTSVPGLRLTVRTAAFLLLPLAFVRLASSAAFDTFDNPGTVIAIVNCFTPLTAHSAAHYLNSRGACPANSLPSIWVRRTLLSRSRKTMARSKLYSATRAVVLLLPTAPLSRRGVIRSATPPTLSPQSLMSCNLTLPVATSITCSLATNVPLAVSLAASLESQMTRLRTKNAYLMRSSPRVASHRSKLTSMANRSGSPLSKSPLLFSAR